MRDSEASRLPKFEMDDSKTQIRNPKYQIGPPGSTDSPNLIFRISDLSFAIVHFENSLP
jgi:hypothetical protein